MVKFRKDFEKIVTKYYENFEETTVYVRWLPQQLTKEYRKNHRGAALNFLTQYVEYRSDLLERIITDNESLSIFMSQKENKPVWFGKKIGRSVEKIQE